MGKNPIAPETSSSLGFTPGAKGMTLMSKAEGCISQKSTNNKKRSFVALSLLWSDLSPC